MQYLTPKQKKRPPTSVNPIQNSAAPPLPPTSPHHTQMSLFGMSPLGYKQTTATGRKLEKRCLKIEKKNTNKQLTNYRKCGGNANASLLQMKRVAFKMKSSNATATGEKNASSELDTACVDWKPDCPLPPTTGPPHYAQVSKGHQRSQTIAPRRPRGIDPPTSVCSAHHSRATKEPARGGTVPTLALTWRYKNYNCNNCNNCKQQQQQQQQQQG